MKGVSGDQYIICPSCGDNVLETKFCLSCGSKMVISKYLSVGVEEPLTEDDINIITYRDDPPSEFNSSSYRRASLDEYDLDPLVKESMYDLKRSADLLLWLVDKFLKGNVEEGAFLRVFESYEYRLEQGLKRRHMMLDDARNSRPMEKDLNEAMLRLSELEHRKIIGDVSDEEYNLKAPLFRWEINNFEEKISKRKIDLTAIEDFIQILNDEELLEMTSHVEKSLELAEEKMLSGIFSEKTGKRIWSALDNTLTTFKSIRNE
jgi:hypothetical protein